MNKSDEIDIGLVFSKISSSIKNKLSHYVNIVKKKILLIVGISLLGGLLGGLFYSASKPTYTTEMLLTSRFLSNQYCQYLIGNLRKIKAEDIDAFARKLNINPETAIQIKDIEYVKFDEKIKESKDSLSLGLPFKIKLHAYDPSIIDTMESSIVNYLENNEFALKRKNTALLYNKFMIEKLQKEIIELDSLKNIIAGNLGSKETTSGIVVGDQIDPVHAYTAGIDLYKQELQLNYGLLIPENIYLIEGFTPKKNPDKPVLIINLLTGLILGFTAGFLIALRLEK